MVCSLRRFASGLFFVLFFVVGCSSDSAEVEEGNAAEEADVTSLDLGEEETGEPDWSGAPLNPFDLRAGECFNEVSWIDQQAERRINITAAIGCEQPHDKEVYHEAEFPAPAGAPFPGEGPMTAWSTELCYEAFADFVGEEYELSLSLIHI